MRNRGQAGARKTALALLLIAGGLGGPLGSRSSSSDLQAAPTVSHPSHLSPRLERAIADLDPETVIPVIVSTGAPADSSDESDAQSAGATVERRFTQLDGYTASVPVGSLMRLAGGPRVRQISFDAAVSAANDLNYATVGADLAARGDSAAGERLDGAGVTVAVVDSGIARHPDLEGRVLDRIEISNAPAGVDDPFGHGTHVAGIIAGDGRLSSGSGAHRRFNGIAPGASLISVRVLDGQGGGRLSDVLAGIDWVLTHRNRYHIRVLNVSLGHPVEESYTTDPLCRALEKAWRAGIVVVAAAGNQGRDGYGTVHSPGNDPYVITVGASNNYLTSSRSDDILTTYSSRGPTALDQIVKPDLLAPGNRTISLRAPGSTLDTSYPQLRIPNGTFSDDAATAAEDSLYFQMSGSSMAAGVVSGMAALMIQADDSLSPDTVKARLMKSAEKRLVYDIFAEGAGFADLIPALAMREVAQAPALSPAAAWTDGGILVQDPGDLWRDSDAWSLPSVFGPDPLRASGMLWADSALWDPDAAASAGTVVCGRGTNGNGSTPVCPDGLLWQGGAKSDRSAPTQASTVVWGGGMKSGLTSPLGADTVVWGGGMKSGLASPVGAETVVWGGGAKNNSTTLVTADTVVWGGGLKSGSTSTVTAETVVWGGGMKSSKDDPMLGDANPTSP